MDILYYMVAFIIIVYYMNITKFSFFKEPINHLFNISLINNFCVTQI